MYTKRSACGERTSGNSPPQARTVPAPDSWLQAFEQLRIWLVKEKTREKRVLFFDEFSWLSTRHSGFLSAFEALWNNFASRNPKLVCVICGSAASWMIRSDQPAQRRNADQCAQRTPRVRVHPRDTEQGARIDLLIDRNDQSINLCEMKFSESRIVIDKRCATEPERRIADFRQRTKTSKARFLTMVTSRRLTSDNYSRALIASEVTLAPLFTN